MQITTQHTQHQKFITTAIDSLSNTLNQMTNPAITNSTVPNTEQQWILLITPSRMPLKSLLRDRVESLSRIIAISADQIDDMQAFLAKVTNSNNFSNIVLLQDTLTVATENQSSNSSVGNSGCEVSFFNNQPNVPSIPKHALF